MLALAIAPERLKIVTGRHSQITEPLGYMHGAKLSARDGENVRRKALGT